MKFLFLVLFLSVAQATLIRDYDVHRDMTMSTRNRFVDLDLKRDVRIPVNKDLIKIQIEILKLLKNVNHLNTDNVILDISKTYRLEDNIDRFLDKKSVTDLIRLHRTEGFLNRDNVLNVFDERHRYELKLITKVLLNAKTLGDFFKVTCWLRNRINCGMFVKALTVAVKNRDDCLGVILPPLYETVPTKFFKNKVIQKALQLKMQGDIFDEKYAKTLGIEQIDTNVYLIKSDYTGVNIQNNGEDKLTYFTEDIGLNNNYYMAHATTPFWLDYDTVKTTRHNDYRRGEFFIFMHQQLLARYNMERLCNGLGEIDTLKFDVPVKTGYNPSLRHHNGLEYSVRPNNYVVNTADNTWMIETFNDFEIRIREAIDRGYIWTDDGKMVTLRKPEDIDKLGNLIQCNRASVNQRYYCGVHHALTLLGNRRVIDDNTGMTPTVLESSATMLRDPVTYQLIKRIMFNVYKFNTKLRPYTYDELTFKGVRINDVKVDKLATYFDTYDVDITNVVNRDMDEMKKNKEDIIIKTRQVRLNHLPFDVTVDVASDITTNVIVKTFLGPKRDHVNRKINLDKNRINFLLLDRHVTTIRKGVNTIVRNSRQFNLATNDMTPTRVLTTKIDKCLKGEGECFTRDVKNTVLIPDRLMLPKGTHGGMTFQLFVTITPVVDRDYEKTDKYDTRITETLRYPLDRKIMRVKEFLSCDNFFMRDVVIFNKEGILDKYTGEVKENLDSTSSESRESTETLRHRGTLDSTEDRDSTERVSNRGTTKRVVVDRTTGRKFLVDDSNDRTRGRDYTLDSTERFWNKRNMHTDDLAGRRTTIDDILGRRDTGEKRYTTKRDDSTERFGDRKLRDTSITREEFMDTSDSRENNRDRRQMVGDSVEQFINRKTYLNNLMNTKYRTMETDSRDRSSSEERRYDDSREYKTRRFMKTKTFDDIYGKDSREMKRLKKRSKLHKYY